MSKLEAAHLARACVWVLMLPVILLKGWQDSILLVLICSLYANAASDVSAWQGARAERAHKD